eukprot:12903543-Alexandrium_andersonii.AAC.1
MSASLVGSGDVYKRQVLHLAPGGRSPPRAAERLPARQQEAPDVREPVSYTHLTLPTICSV